METAPISVAPETPVQEVIRLMNERRIGAVMVLGGEGALVGIFTERDLLRRVVTAVPGWRDYPVSQWMTKDPYTTTPDLGWDEAVGTMQKLRVRHLPVLEQGRIIGLLSFRGLMAVRSDYLNRKVEERTHELRRAYDQLLSREAETAMNLRAAGRLHRQLVLPKAPPKKVGLRWAMHYKPLDHLGGDYYDFAEPSPGFIGAFIADGSGHSIPAALLAIMARVAFGEESNRSNHPGHVLTAVNRRLAGIAEERFVSGFYGVLDTVSRSFRFANAGHPHPLRYHHTTGDVTPLSASGFLLGILPDEEYREKEITLSPGDKLCLFTDGLIEARNEIGEMFGNERLTGCLRNNGHRAAQELLDHIVNCLTSFRGSQSLTDDLTILILEIGAD